jgi:hypothetical protein
MVFFASQNQLFSLENAPEAARFPFQTDLRTI